MNTPEIVVPTAEERRDPLRMAALREQAKAAGKLVMGDVINPHRERVEAWAAETTQTVSAGDHRAFLDNLAEIARGRVRVVD